MLYSVGMLTQKMQLLRQGVEELPLMLTESQLDQFEVYYRELEEWNQHVNLTAITGYEEVQIKHFLDSLTACLVLPEGLSPGARVIDLGSGAGLPGLALKLAFPEICLSLVDSVGKKTAFMRRLVDTLRLTGVTVYTARAEELAHQPSLRESFQLALARGLAKMPALMEYTLPFCARGGKVIAWKHGGIDEEVGHAAKAMKTLGGKLSVMCPVPISGLTDNRILVVVDKVKPTPKQYPRRVGVPSKQPL